MGGFPVKYDDWEWHWRGKFPRGRKRSQAYVHIAVYLAWIVRRDLHEPELFGSFGAELEREVARIRTGHSLGMSIREHLDGSLSDEQLNATGRAFTATYYGAGEQASTYLDDWTWVFGEAADDYAVAPTEDTFGRMAPILDARFAAWRAGSSPPWPDTAELVLTG